jgi:DNA-binding NtrC family response regulator
MSQTILFVDDDADILKTAELLIGKAGYGFRAARSPAEAYSVLAAEPVDLILLDLNFSRSQVTGEEGLAFLREIRRQKPGTAVVVVTGHSGLTIAVQALRLGALNFIMKPWSNERFLEAIAEALSQRQRLGRDATDGADSAEPDLIVGDSAGMARVRGLIERYARLSVSVLISGEAGTGKSQVARALHRQSGRSSLRVLSAAELAPGDLGDITDATLIIENVDQIQASMATLLGAWLQGAGQSNSRCVATTTRALGEVELPRDLLYALSTLEIHLPPLEERGDDIDYLANHFSRVFAMKQGLGVKSIAPDALTALKSIHLPHNLHSLRKIVERAAIMAEGPVIGPADIDLPGVNEKTVLGEGRSLEATERAAIEAALKRADFNVSKAAADLGVTRQALYRRMVRHGL